MAAVETLEVRFQANIGSLSASISYLIGRIGSLNAAAISARAAIGNLGAGASLSLIRLSGAAQDSARRQTKLASRLKNTSRALRGVAASAKAATDGIGLHRLDEVNLVGERDAVKRSGGRGGGRGSIRGGAKSAKDAIAAIEDIWAKLGRFMQRVGEVCKGVVGSFAGAFQKVDDFTGGMLSGVAGTLASGARNAAQKFAQNLADGLTQSSAPQTAGGKITSFASAIAAGAARIRTAAQTAAKSAVFQNDATYSGAYGAGANLSIGFANGIGSKISAIASAAKKAAQSALSKLKKLLKIASPSKAAFAMGGYFGEGFANGILSTVKMAESGAAALSGAAMRAVRSADVPLEDGGIGSTVRGAVQGALGDGNIVVPLYVDGVKLGEAAIRGINRVTRSAGRVLLEI